MGPHAALVQPHVPPLPRASRILRPIMTLLSGSRLQARCVSHSSDITSLSADTSLTANRPLVSAVEPIKFTASSYILRLSC